MKFEDGSEYSGEFQNNEINGNGKWQYPNGDVYLGEFKDAQRHGFGILKCMDHSFYFGNWLNNLKNGNGKQIYSNGDKFNGKWENNLRVVGKFESNNLVYDGEFKYNLFHGKGELKTKPNKIFVGTFVKGLRFGAGTLINDNIKYEGNWVNNLPEGKGTLYKYKKAIIQNGEKDEKDESNPIELEISGIWKEGKSNGTTIIKQNGETVFQGNVINGIKHGEGMLLLPNNKFLVTGWENGRILNQSKMVININNEKIRKTIRYHPTEGSELMCEYKNGRISREKIELIQEHPSQWVYVESLFNLEKCIWY
ncbi:hypothetical protein M0813_13469 [Anaeramoeba flamelloides]|uniref:MORN repeat protein n=1 Tax=Anaeramoeba flamelloides TaxID=1746091 RepID=A0ABQ8Z8B7_9EUKA|nr:hypothetical protein M0813_13469 [Anaeramoeba flamelloides]